MLGPSLKSSKSNWEFRLTLLLNKFLKLHLLRRFKVNNFCEGKFYITEVIFIC
jgi:hypothetical protein